MLQVRTKRFFYIPLIVFSLLLSLPGAVLWAQTTDDEIKLIKQQIEVLSRRLEELEEKRQSKDRSSFQGETPRQRPTPRVRQSPREIAQKKSALRVVPSFQIC